jgi:hypothetical protein
VRKVKVMRPYANSGWRTALLDLAIVALLVSVVASYALDLPDWLRIAGAIVLVPTWFYACLVRPFRAWRASRQRGTPDTDG